MTSSPPPSVVAGWSDDDSVYLVFRAGEKATIRQYDARWSLFLARRPGTRDRLTGERRVAAFRADGERYWRVDCNSRRDRWSLVDELVRSYGRDAVLEADVRPLERYLADNPDVPVAAASHWVNIDVETDPRAGILAAKAGKSRIVSWAAEGHDGRWRRMVLEEDSDDAEREILRELLRFLNRYDIVVAHYGGGDRESDSGFDFDCIRNRCAALGIAPRSWHRWAWLDYLECIALYHQGGDGEEKSSLALDHLARNLIDPVAMHEHARSCSICAYVWYTEGEVRGPKPPEARKLDVEATEIWNLWADPISRERVGRYNLWDVHLMTLLEGQYGFLMQHLEVCQLCRVIPHTRSTGATVQADGMFLGIATGQRWATKWPKDKTQADNKKFQGAIVQEPTMTGVIPHEVAVWDFAGMYPSITMALNAGPDSKLQPDMKEPQVVAPMTGTRFAATRDSAFIETTKRLIAMRKRYQDLAKKETPGTPQHRMLSAKAQAAKIVTNSISYGVIGAPSSRFYDREVAESVSTTARWLKETVVRWALEWGFQVIYGDTDSDFTLLFDGKTWEEVQRFCDWVNAQWQRQFESLGTRWPVTVRLEAEKSFSRLILVAKKAYAGALRRYKGKDAAKGAREIRGLELVRGDSLRPARAMQAEIIDRILGDGHDLPALPSEVEVLGWLASWRERLMSGQIRRDDLVFSQGMGKPIEHYFKASFTAPHCKKCRHDFGSKKGHGAETCPKCGTARTRGEPPPHARVALELQRQGAMIQVGDKIDWVAVLDPDVDGSKVCPSVKSHASLARLDMGYYWKRIADPSVRILSGLGHSTNYGALVATESAAIRKDAVRRVRASSDAGLPLLASVQVAAAPVTVEVATPEDVEYLHAMVSLCRGRHPLVIEIVSASEPRRTCHCDDKIYGVDPRALGAMSRVVPVSGTRFRIKSVVAAAG